MKMSESKSQDAIVVRSAQKCYAKHQPNILDGLNMTVPKGCIYGLLGASGCGKTTLLSCVVGVCGLDFGDIWVLGGRPGERDSGIPGPRVGYMPQEISLVPEMSIIDSLYYFGRINGLEDPVIVERFEFLSDLLELPPKGRLIKNLSGGQQRRVSFAAALIHKPELLILDEPTVGLDSILREKIWNFLIKITREDGVTVIITTHYIEETKQADRIGLMRCGKLLAETTPAKIIEKFGCSTLEEAFLILSRQQEENRLKGVTEVSDDLTDRPKDIVTISDAKLSTDTRGSGLIVSSSSELTHNNDNEFRKKSNSRPVFNKIFKALMIKNLLQFLRHPGGIIIAFIFPTMQMTFFFYTIGNDPHGIVVAIVNEEAGNCDNGKSLGSIVYDPGEGTCHYKDISCRFLNEFNESIMVKQYYDTLDEATSVVQVGGAFGVMHFMSNFSKAFEQRREDVNSLTDDAILTSQIHTMLDMGDRQIGLWLQKKLFDRFIEVHGDIVTHCNITRKFADVPVHFEDPIFGSNDLKFSDFMAPGFILSICCFLATGVSSSIIIDDKAEGVWNRSLVQGVKSWTILSSHILTQMLCITIQVVMVLCVSFGYFQLQCKGSFLYVIAIIWLTGFMGMCYGFLISCFCKSHTLSNLAATGTYYPLILLGGCIWPLEGMPAVLQYFSLCTPLTLPSIALRSLLEKGFSLSNPEIYGGFLVIFGWTTVFIVCCLLSLRKKSS